MAGTLDYSTTAGSNTTVGGVSVAEGMAPGNVNNAMRAMMADSRKWQLDWSGVTTAGAADAYTLTCNQGITAYADGQRFSFRADRNNTGAATLNIDARGAKALRKVTSGALAALIADDIVEKAIYDVVFNSADDVFVIVGSGVPADIQTQLDAKQPLDADLTAIASTGLTTSHIAAATLVTAADTIASNDNDTTLPTSAAVKDYADAAVVGAVPTQTAALSVGAVGSYAFLGFASNTTAAAGSTHAGSGLRYSNGGAVGPSGTPSGTWRLMGATDSTGPQQSTSLFLRIS